MSTPAARVGDMTIHGGAITGPGVPNVLIGGMPAATAGDLQACPLSNGPVPHGTGPIVKGSLTVFIGGKPAARVNDPCICVGAPNQIAPPGCPTVFIGG
jgi:uncharacterized Zn-binding protein involved in type VI secretion